MKPLVLLARNIFDVGLGGNHEGFLWTHSLSTTTPLAIGVSFFSIMSLLTSNKISAHFLLSVKRLKTRSLGRTVCFLQIRSISCLMCSQLGIRFNQFKIVRKALFFNLISAPICTRSFPRGFSLATPNYVLCRRLPSLLQNLYSLGHDS